MDLSLTQIFFSIFLLFALSRVILRFKDGELSSGSLFFWSAIFGAAIILVLNPGITSRIASIIGIGRGADIVIYTSIVLLFYLVFRIYVYLQDIKHDISEIVTKIALKEKDQNHDRKSSKD